MPLIPSALPRRLYSSPVFRRPNKILHHCPHLHLIDPLPSPPTTTVVVGVVVEGTVVTEEAAATTSTTLPDGGNHGAATGACPGLVPRDLVSLAPVHLPCWVRLFKPINRQLCKLLCKLPLGIPQLLFKLFRQSLFSNPTTKVIGTWIPAHRPT
jgi:hypothetical protein